MTVRGINSTHLSGAVCTDVLKRLAKGLSPAGTCLFMILVEALGILNIFSIGPVRFLSKINRNKLPLGLEASLDFATGRQKSSNTIV